MAKVEFTHFKELDYAAQESINTLCTNLTFLGSEKRRIMITSCQQHEGKSMLSMNVMRTLAKLGHTVVLVDCDLRRSQLVAKYGIKCSSDHMNGMTHYLAGLATMNDVVYETNVEGAYFVPSGHLVSNSLALLSTPRFSAMLEELAGNVEYVIIDAPPVGMIIDAAEIAKNCDGTIIAVKYNSVDRKELLETKQQIEATGCEVLGAVLNQVSFNTVSSKKYYYKSYYYKYDKKYYKADHHSND